MKSIGDNLKLYRIKSKMSLTEAGKVAGLSPKFCRGAID